MQIYSTYNKNILECVEKVGTEPRSMIRDKVGHCNHEVLTLFLFFRFLVNLECRNENLLRLYPTIIKERKKFTRKSRFCTSTPVTK